MKTLLHEKLFALALAGVTVFTVFSGITAPLAAALHNNPGVGAEVAGIARVVVTGKRMSEHEKVEYDARALANASSSLHKTAAR